MFRKGGQSTAIVSGGRRKVHTTFEGGQERGMSDRVLLSFQPTTWALLHPLLQMVVSLLRSMISRQESC
jgi:hypothetical protein